MFRRERSRDFEKGWMRIPSGDEMADIPQSRCDFVFRNHFAIHANAFAESDKVRGGEETSLKISRATNGIDHRTNRSFSVCAGDVNNTRVAETDIQLGDQPPDILQPEFDPEALKAVKPGERLFVIDRGVSRRANSVPPGS
jgi:hypothetical protein